MLLKCMNCILAATVAPLTGDSQTRSRSSTAISGSGRPSGPSSLVVVSSVYRPRSKTRPPSRGETTARTGARAGRCRTTGTSFSTTTSRTTCSPSVDAAATTRIVDSCSLCSPIASTPRRRRTRIVGVLFARTIQIAVAAWIRLEG